MVLLVATREMRYAAKQYNRGDQFEASDKDARILKAIKKATDAPEEKAPPPRAPLPRATAPTPPPGPTLNATPVARVPEAAAPKAEPPPPVVTSSTSEPVKVVSESAPASLTTKYKRRDLSAQE